MRLVLEVPDGTLGLTMAYYIAREKDSYMGSYTITPKDAHKYNVVPQDDGYVVTEEPILGEE